jgi:hypothetical protein
VGFTLDGVPRETKDTDVAVISANADQLVTLLSSDGLAAVAAFDRVPFGGPPSAAPRCWAVTKTPVSTRWIWLDP